MSDLKIDREQWRLFLKTLGKTKDKVRLRAFFPKGHLLKADDRGKKSDANIDWITKCQEEGRGVYLVVNDGGDTDSSITHCKALFCEWDDRSKTEQIEAWKNLGLHEPSLQIDTGGKSIHNYWILKKAVDPKTWKPIQERLLEYADADRALKNPSRVMRLPGTHHMNADGTAGGLTKIIHTSGKTYSLKEIIDRLPTPKIHQLIKESSNLPDYKPQPMNVIEDALQYIPQKKSGDGQYINGGYRNMLWGLIKACEEAGKDKQYAINLMESHSPAWSEIKQCANSGGEKINSSTFWHWAKTHGFKPPTTTKIYNPVSDFQGEDEEEYSISGDRPQKLEAGDFLQMLKTIPKTSKRAYRYNLFTQQIEREHDYGEHAGQIAACQGEYALDRIYLKLAEKNFKISKEVAFDCVVQVARENEYDPVKEYLEWCEKNAAPEYIDRLASTYLRPDDARLPEPTIYDQMMKCTLIAAVARVFEPGCKFDNACVLMGEQAARKSSFWACFGKEWFSDALKDINGKDSLMILHKSFIMEFAELDYLNTKRQAGEVKAFLSQSTDVFRVPYGKVTEVFPRRGIIVGTTNRSENFLLDDTGSRRFWIIPTTCTLENPINVGALQKEVDGLWASAVMAYKNKEPWNLDVKAELEITEQNQTYLMENPWKNIIAEHVNAPHNVLQEFTTNRILTEVIEKPLERQTRYDQTQVAIILKDLGLVKRRLGSKGNRKWVYTRERPAIMEAVNDQSSMSYTSEEF